MLASLWSNRKFHSLMAEMQDGTFILKDSLVSGGKELRL